MSMIERFERNTAGRDIIVGDIHGKFSVLWRQLEEIGFNQDVDRLFSVGDLVDRGPESEDVLSWLAHPWFHAVQGNHEQMACMYAAGDLNPEMYAYNGGAWFIGKTISEQHEYALAFAQLPWAIEIETKLGVVGGVHAAVDNPTWAEFKADIEAKGTGLYHLE
jgi:serine/threonine protein phosphatase 1